MVWSPMSFISKNRRSTSCGKTEMTTEEWQQSASTILLMQSAACTRTGRSLSYEGEGERKGEAGAEGTGCGRWRVWVRVRIGMEKRDRDMDK